MSRIPPFAADAKEGVQNARILLNELQTRLDCCAGAPYIAKDIRSRIRAVSALLNSYTAELYFNHKQTDTE